MTEEPEKTDEDPAKPKRKPRATRSGPEHFRVQAQMSWGQNGCIRTISAGTVVSSETHDLKELVRRGVVLEKCEAPSSKST